MPPTSNVVHTIIEKNKEKNIIKGNDKGEVNKYIRLNPLRKKI